jgi:predicted lipoprotein with Yx(FWY)xxD motif
VKSRIIGLLAFFVVAACGTTTTASTSNPTSSSPAAGGAAATIAVASNSKLGQILVDGSGRTVYLFQADKGTASVCYADCAVAWPPVITHGAPQAGAGATAALIGTTTRKDGSLQVTYNGHPLYYWVADHNPGDTTGQNLNNFGGAWFVLSPRGTQIGG